MTFHLFLLDTEQTPIGSSPGKRPDRLGGETSSQRYGLDTYFYIYRLCNWLVQAIRFMYETRLAAMFPFGTADISPIILDLLCHHANLLEPIESQAPGML